jgi:preprotein translocase subunit SecF
LTASARRAYGFNVIFDKGSILQKTGEIMNLLLIVIVVIAVVLLFTGGFVSSLNFLLWIGIVLLVLAVIGFLLRSISGRRA